MKNSEHHFIHITADGKCENPDEKLRNAAEKGDLTSITVLIDGTKLKGGRLLTSLLGNKSDFLDQSLSYTLISMEPQEDGKCLVTYNVN